MEELKQKAEQGTDRSLRPLFLELHGRVAVLGGNGADKTGLLVGLALQQIERNGKVMCVDGRREKKTEVQFRLLLRSRAAYLPLPASLSFSPAVERALLIEVGQALKGERHSPPPLLLFDSVTEQPGVERMVTFLLNAGVTVVELLPSPQALRFGRYNATLLLHVDSCNADALSRAVGRKVTPAELLALGPGEGLLVKLAQSFPVELPQMRDKAAV